MQYEDKMTIATPEGVSLDVTLAGAGSRGGAAVLDGLIQFGLIFLLALMVGIIGASVDDGGDFGPGGSSSELALFAIAIFNIVLFVVLFFYFVLFETLWSAYLPIVGRDIALYAALVVFLIYRPGGFFGVGSLAPRLV